jgi:type II secretory pathway component GspD/PulD (secretin)/Flp pilus assembly protein TadD
MKVNKVFSCHHYRSDESCHSHESGNLLKEIPACAGMTKRMRKNCLSLFIVVVFLISPFGVYCAQENQQDQEESANDKISLDLKNVDIVELLRIVSLKTGKTIVPSKEVAGRITVYLSNVAFNDVLDIVLLTQGLALSRKGNIYYVMSEAEYRKVFGKDYIDQRKIQTIKLVYAKPSVIFAALAQLKSDVGKIVVDESSGTIILIDIPEKLVLLNKMIKNLDRPLTTTIYDLNYIKPADAKAQFTLAITPGTGEVIIDERSGKAIISDLPQKMQKMNMLVRELDEKSRQVYVEADIIELTLSDKFERGIDWSAALERAAQGGLIFAGHYPAALTAAYQQLSVGTLNVNQYAGIIQFLNTYGKTNIISQPRIAIVNNEEGSVMVGVREAYITQTQSQATSTTVTSETVEFIDVGVKLKIVPRIGADNFITMKIKPEVSSVKETITTTLGSRIPIVQTSQSETVVKVKNGTMIMIAGMTRIEDTDSIVGLPVLSKIPFIGALFSSRTSNKVRTEVIIFLTPRLSSGDADLRGAEITKIIPMEHLPENLQKKVTRDTVIDKGLFDPEKMKQEQEIKQANELDTEETRVRKAEQAAKIIAAKAAEKAAKAAAKKEKEKIKSPAVEKIENKAIEKAVKQIVAAKEKKPTLEKTAKDYYQKGLWAQADSDLKEAILNFTKATEIDNKYAAAYNNLGIIYEQESKFQKAEEMYLKAIAVDLKYCPAYANLALFNEDRQDFAKALEYWRKRVLYGDPDSEWTKQALKRIKELEN